MLCRFHLVSKRNGQTDGRTDGRTDRIAISISRVSMLTRDKKLIWCGYPKIKFFEDMSIRFDTIHQRDRRTDGQTDIHTDRHRMTA